MLGMIWRKEMGRSEKENLDKVERVDLRRVQRKETGRLEKEELGKMGSKEVGPSTVQHRQRMRDFYSERKPKQRALDVSPEW